MRIFITGGTGFIGRPTVESLLRRGHRVLVLTREKKPRRALRGVTYIYGDLEHLPRLTLQVKRFRPDAALHLAWDGIGFNGTPDFSPEMSMRNLINGIALVHFAGSVGCKRILGVGSDKEYGIPTGQLHESMGLHPGSPFSAAKTALHWMGKEVAKKYGMEFIWTRVFFAYGPGQRLVALIPHLLLARARGTAPEIRNLDGANDFINTADIARALVLLVEKKILAHDLYNIASGHLTSVREIVNLVYGKKTRAPAPKKDAGAYADISRLKKDTGWSPKITIAQGIKAMEPFYKPFI